MDPRGYVTTEEARDALNRIYQNDAETNLQAAFLIALSDDLKPIDSNGRWRPSSLLIIICLLICALVALFLYFSIGRPK
jgi:hypothetical protein